MNCDFRHEHNGRHECFPVGSRCGWLRLAWCVATEWLARKGRSFLAGILCLALIEAMMLGCLAAYEYRSAGQPTAEEMQTLYAAQDAMRESREDAIGRALAIGGGIQSPGGGGVGPP